MEVKLNENRQEGLLLEASVLLLMALGTVFVFSAGATLTGALDASEFYNFTTLKRIVYFPAAVLVMYAVSRVDYRRFSFQHAAAYKSWTPYLMALTLGLLILVLVPGIGVEKNYARRWLLVPLGPASVSFQPSELAKWCVVIFMAAYADIKGERIRRYLNGFIPACFFLGAVTALIITQDFGTAAFIAVLGFLILLAGGAKFWHFLTFIPVVVPAFAAAVLVSTTRINRFKAFLGRFFPETFPGASEIAANYQAQQSLIAISTGGLWGKGLGRGVCKYGHLPEDTTDFIFSVICEELGFAGALLVIGLFAALAVCGIRVILKCPDRFGKLLAGGIIICITAQALINIGVVTVVLPTKGISLPFVSAGGSGMLLSAAGVGLLLSIIRKNA